MKYHVFGMASLCKRFCATKKIYRLQKNARRNATSKKKRWNNGNARKMNTEGQKWKKEKKRGKSELSFFEVDRV